MASFGELSTLLEGALVEYNETNALMDLVLFEVTLTPTLTLTLA